MQICCGENQNDFDDVFSVFNSYLFCFKAFPDFRERPFSYTQCKDVACNVFTLGNT